MNIGDIIRRYREQNKLSMEDFARRAGISRAYVSILENNVNPSTGLPAIPSLKTIRSVAAAMGMDSNSLLDIVDPDTEVSLLDDDLENFNFLPVTTRKIPIIGNVHCGVPEYAEEDFLDIVDSDIRADFALRANGDSMIGVGIEDGDLVFVRKQPEVNNGELAVVLLKDEAAIKRVYKHDTYMTLTAENPAYAPIMLHDGDGQEISILGKVVAHTHFYKERK